MTKLITDPESLRLTVDPPKLEVLPTPVEDPHIFVGLGVMNPNGLKRLTVESKKLPTFLATQELRDVHQAAVVYWQATRDRTLMDLLAKAVTFAESVEDPKDVSKCIVCDVRIPKGKNYCGFDCAETDGAIEK